MKSWPCKTVFSRAPFGREPSIRDIPFRDLRRSHATDDEAFFRILRENSRWCQTGVSGSLAKTVIDC